MRTLVTVILLLMVCMSAGCDMSGANLYTALQHEDPSVRIQAVHTAGKTKDPKAVPYLIDRLTDSESDVRFYAIQALKRSTGETMGYEYYEPAAKRAEAVRRWREWLGASRPKPSETETTK